MRTFITILFSLFIVVLFGQNKRDYIWLNGRDYQLGGGIENYIFDFNETPFSIKPLSGGLEFDNNNAVISDYGGNLLFYSNGCAVANRNHELMPNGEDINAGDWFEIVWLGDCKFGYAGFQDIMTLPDPYQAEGYYLLTKPRIYNETGPTYYRDVQFSYIDMNLDNGLGNVTIKNEVVYDLDTIQGSYMHAVKHGNKKDWWVLLPSKQQNRYLKFLIDSSGYHFDHAQEIGPDFHWNSSSAGMAKFSPDGKKYAYYNKFSQLLLYDFDRETGMLSNLKEIEIDSIPIFNGIEFSASGRFLYFALQTHLYQLDLHQLDGPDALLLIDEWNGVVDPFSTRFFLTQRGPDCRIYITSQSSTNTYHVINNPDEKGEACDFVQQGLPLPFTSGFASLPNFPNFRIDEDEYCDPTLTSIFNFAIPNDDRVKLYPNPVFDLLNIHNASAKVIKQISVYNSNGQHLISELEPQSNLDVSKLSKGFYNLLIHFEDGAVQHQSFVKM